METNSNTATALETNLLRALALMQHNGDDFFILGSKAYEGTRENAKEMFDEYLQDYKDNGAKYVAQESHTFEQFCENSLGEVDELDPEDYNNDYLVLTDEEANEKAAEYISDTMWAFNISFLTSYMSEETAEFAEDILKPIQEKCESGNEAVKALVNWKENKEQIIEDAISADGRGNFLSKYDGNENEETVNGITFYIYRLN